MNPSRTRTAGRIALATVLSAGLLLTACSDDDDSADKDATETTASSEPSVLDQSTGGGDGSDGGGASGEVVDGVLTVELADYSFEGVPASVPAGTRLEVENTSSVEYHEMVVIRLPDGEERSAEELLALPEEELDGLLGGPPAAVLLAGPDGGEQVAAVGDGTLTEPGRYILFCAIPTGADPDVYAEAAENPEAGPPAEDPDAGPPHFVQGMVTDLVVE